MPKQNKDQKYWFRAKIYGLGWYPTSWQGWLILLAYVSFIIFDLLRYKQNLHSLNLAVRGFFPELVIATIILTTICYLKGEPLHWYREN